MFWIGSKTENELIVPEKGLRRNPTTNAISGGNFTAFDIIKNPPFPLPK
jgi:hypothetical protein